VLRFSTPVITLRRRHRLGLAGARRLAEMMAGRLQADYGGSYRWQGNALHFQRVGASGHLAVSEDTVEIQIQLGFLLRPLQSRIEREVRAFCDEHLRGPGSSDRAAAGREGPSRRARGGSSGRPRRAAGTPGARAGA